MVELTPTVAKDVTELIGKTPLVYLNNVTTNNRNELPQEVPHGKLILFVIITIQLSPGRIFLAGLSKMHTWIEKVAALMTVVALLNYIAYLYMVIHFQNPKQILLQFGYRWSQDSPWEAFQLGSSNFDWKKNAELVMKHYTEATDGSCFEHKDSALVWHHQDADLDFGSWQEKELLDHLESVLANGPVSVKSCQAIVGSEPSGKKKKIDLNSCSSNLITERLHTCQPRLGLVMGYS